MSTSNINKYITQHSFRRHNKCFWMREQREGAKNKKKVTKKGILITALLVTAIVGASFLVYFIPQ